ncbi:MAG TPA: response regulator [Labilithrix sp.]|nr:response regulator [Labilithrix sp.]
MNESTNKPAPKIIVADDDPLMRDLLAYTLREEGYDVVEVPDGGRLLVQLATHFRSVERLPADLVISDIRMPVLSGLAMLRALRDAHWMRPVILMTAFPDDEVKRSAARLGAELLEKPFTMALLRERVRAALASDDGNAAPRR